MTVVESGLEIVKDGQAMQFLDKTASYTIKVTNTGDVDLDDVVVPTLLQPVLKSHLRGMKSAVTLQHGPLRLMLASPRPSTLKLVGREHGVRLQRS